MPFYDHPPFPFAHLQGDHPLHVGPLGYNGSKAAMEMISRADVVLALGTRCNGEVVKPADSKRESFFHPFAKTEKKNSIEIFRILKSPGLISSCLSSTVMLQNALNHIEPTVTDVSFDTSVLLSRLNPFSTLPCYGIEYWPKDAKLIQAQILRDQLTLWLFTSGITLPSYIGIIFKTGWRLWPPTRAISPGRGSRLSKPIDRTHIAQPCL